MHLSCLTSSLVRTAEYSQESIILDNLRLPRPDSGLQIRVELESPAKPSKDVRYELKEQIH